MIKKPTIVQIVIVLFVVNDILLTQQLIKLFSNPGFCGFHIVCLWEINQYGLFYLNILIMIKAIVLYVGLYYVIIQLYESDIL